MLQIPEVAGGRAVFKQMACGEGSECGGPVGERLNNSKESSKRFRVEMFNRFRLLWVSFVLALMGKTPSHLSAS